MIAEALIIIMTFFSVFYLSCRYTVQAAQQQIKPDIIENNFKNAQIFSNSIVSSKKLPPLSSSISIDWCKVPFINAEKVECSALKCEGKKFEEKTFSDEEVHHNGFLMPRGRFCVTPGMSLMPAWKYTQVKGMRNAWTIVDKAPHFPIQSLARGVLVDTLSQKPVFSAVNLYEINKNGSFRYQMKCDKPFIGHPDFPGLCFQDPCTSNVAGSDVSAVSASVGYDSKTKKCVCGDPLITRLVNLSNDETSPCIPATIGKAGYTAKTETLIVHVPCWKKGDAYSKLTNAYPCSEIFENKQSLNVEYMRVNLRVTENIEDSLTKSIENAFKEKSFLFDNSV